MQNHEILRTILNEDKSVFPSNRRPAILHDPPCRPAHTCPIYMTLAIPPLGGGGSMDTYGYTFHITATLIHSLCGCTSRGNGFDTVGLCLINQVPGWAFNITLHICYELTTGHMAGTVLYHHTLAGHYLNHCEPQTSPQHMKQAFTLVKRTQQYQRLYSHQMFDVQAIVIQAVS